MSLEFITNLHVPRAQRAALFCRQMHERFSVALDIHPQVGQSLATEISAYCGRRLHFAALRTSAHRTSAVPVDADKLPRLMVTLQDEGHSTIRQHGNKCELTPGTFCLIDPVESFDIETSAIRIRSVYLDRTQFLACFPQISVVTARAFAGAQGPGALFRSMFDEMFRLGASLDDDTADSIADSLPFVLATSLRQLMDRPADRDISRLRAYHKHRIRRFARGSLSDPQLCVLDIARGVSLSERYVHELFAEDDLSPMKWVWSARLANCKRDLTDPALLGRSISQIASGWGFSDMSHFSKAFKAHYLQSPRRFRANGRAAAACKEQRNAAYPQPTAYSPI
jgi:AraC family transcriptional activator of tynA and feaB